MSCVRRFWEDSLLLFLGHRDFADRRLYEESSFGMIQTLLPSCLVAPPETIQATVNGLFEVF